MNKIIINFDKESYYDNMNMNLRRPIVFEFNEETKIRELLIYLSSFVDYTEDLNENKNLYGHYSFIYRGNEIKGNVDYNLYNFLKNYNYDFNNVIMTFHFAFGIGGPIEFEDIAKISINANEPQHNNAHIHITKIGSKNTYRIDVKTKTQLKGDKIPWEKDFTLKERKLIIEFINENEDKICEYYDRVRNGEYIQEDYIFALKDKKYTYYQYRNY